MGDLVPETDQEEKVLHRLVVEGTLASGEALPKVPVLEGAIRGSLGATSFARASVVAILHARPALVSVEQVRPGDAHEDDERLRLEAHEGLLNT
jgi:hypothetical protein